MTVKKQKSFSKTDWLPLKPGDTVDIVAPGWGTTVDELTKGIEFLTQIGLIANVPADLLGEDLICSNTKSVRLTHLKNALANKKSKAIWCLRGGYGSIQLAPELLKWPKPKTPKVLIGYSDITTLFAIWNQKWKLPTLHAPLLDRLGKRDLPLEQVENLLNILFGRVEKVQFKNLSPMNKAAQKNAKIKGAVVGGNLTVVTSSIGTPAALKPNGQIVFFEDTGERGYRIDRMLRQLEQSGFFKGVKAIVLGVFTGGEDKDGVIRTQDVWQEFAQNCKIPVLRGVPAGHGSEQWTVPLGTQANLVLGRNAHLEITTGAKL